MNQELGVKYAESTNWWIISNVTNGVKIADEHWISCHVVIYSKIASHIHKNKANLRDLIAATGLVIPLKLDSNRRFYSPCDLEIWWMTLKNDRAPLLCYIKLGALFQAIGEFKLELQSGNAQFGSKSAIYCPVWPWNLTDDLEKQ